ncbi:MAG: putative PEP-binding protein [Treponema sp.]
MKQKSIHFINRTKSIKIDNELLGIKGKEINELSNINIPILPCIVIDVKITKLLEKSKIFTLLIPYIKKIEDEINKKYNNMTDPMLLKITLSSNLLFSENFILHSLGLTKSNVKGLEETLGKDFVVNELLFLLDSILSIYIKIAELENKEVDQLLVKLKDIKTLLKTTKQDALTIMNEYERYLPKGFFEDVTVQLTESLKLISHKLKLEDEDAAILIQPMVYGNYGKDLYEGYFFTRNIVTGIRKIQGEFFQNNSNKQDLNALDINLIESNLLKELGEIALAVEDKTKEIRKINFTIEKGKLWLIDQTSVKNITTIALIQLLLSLYKRKIIDAKYVIKTISSEQLNEILHPIIDSDSTENIKKSIGGIAGSAGVVSGKVYFSTNALIEAKKKARVKGENLKCILCMTATYSGDVKAIEVAQGVLSSEGGYAAHASVIARQYGKASLVRKDMQILEKKAIIDGYEINEGDEITLSVAYHEESIIYFGKVRLIEGSYESTGLLEVIKIASSFIKDFHVRANADSAKEAKTAIGFGASGIGLCRTEHMFFNEERINIFREMIITKTKDERENILEQLKQMQIDDFYNIFKVMEGKEVTIRLLDAPLHEFLPHNENELEELFQHLKKTGKIYNKIELKLLIEMFSEINPMLGHRGCRIAISYPEIYAMQIEAIFEALYNIKKEGININLEIMIPFVMNFRELKQIVYGKNIEGHSYFGINSIEENLKIKFDNMPFSYKIGTMIELPVAVLNADKISRYAQFFSFGTNDLTQAALGISRDDFNSFMPDYSMYDLIDNNPFVILDESVKELIQMGIIRGKLTRPDLVFGLCGEHGARAENIKTFMELGGHYVSCSPYSVPIALLTVAKLEIEKMENSEVLA